MDNDYSRYIKFDRIVEPYHFVGHLPVVYYLIKTLQPSVVVELGTYSGNSFCGICQSIRDHNISSRAYAIDTWRGDKHTGFYDDRIYNALKTYVSQQYPFARLLRATFDEAARQFENNEIDFLHIDGLHTYDAVYHDFNRWLPKMKSSGIIILHDIAVEGNDFGVYRLWKEIKERMITVEFEHSYGLGITFLSDSFRRPQVGNLYKDLQSKRNRDWITLHGELIFYKHENVFIKNQYHSIKNSYSYKIGKGILAPLKLLKRVFKY